MVYLFAATDGAGQWLSGVSAMDIVLLVLLLGGMAFGFWTGFIKQLVYIGSVVGSFWTSWLYHGVVADYLSEGMSEPARKIVAAIAVFVACLLICYLLAFLFRDLVNALKPGVPDRILGGVFGGLFVTLLVGVFAFLAGELLDDSNALKTQLRRSKGANVAAVCARAFLYVLPLDLDERLEKGELGPITQMNACRPPADGPFSM